MDKKLEIQLPELRNVESVNVDLQEKIVLNNKNSELNEYSIRNVLSATEVFDAEREANEVYRIYGRIEWMSLLNGITPNYDELQHFFLPYYYTAQQTMLDKFDFYLVKPSTGYTKVEDFSNVYIRYFEVLATPNEIDIFPAAFSKNVFSDQGYVFNINIDIDISDSYDEFGFPTTELFLYCQYKKSAAPNPAELVSMIKWNPDNANQIEVDLLTTTQFIGSHLTAQNGVKISDVVEYDKLNFSQEEFNQQNFIISTPYDGQRLEWEYNPFIPIRLRYLSDSLYQANSGSTNYNLVQSIPNYATSIDSDGNFVWRTILPDGYIDPFTGTGVDNPFINKKRMSFSSIILDTIPNLAHGNTNFVFNEVNFDTPIKIDELPINDDINDIGKPCK